MKLNIYTDDTFTEVKETRECDKIKIPYRVGQYVVNVLANTNLDDDMEIIKKALESEEQITKIVRATFGLKEDELEFVNVLEIAETAQQISAFVLEKMAEMGLKFGEDSNPNQAAPATI